MLTIRPAFWIACGLLSTSALAPQETHAPAPAAAPAGEVVSFHIVRSGDTLNRISTLYQGSPEFTPVNHRLNPHVKDPDLIHPGRRLRLRLGPEAAKAPVARLDDLSRRVEELPRPEAWISAVEGDLLLAGDGLRTYDDASARLRFGDGTHVVASENAVLFVRPAQGSQPAKAARDGALEVVRGRADLELRPAGTAGESRFEVVMGGAKATASAPGPKAAKSRVRQEEKGGSKLMMFGGKASVAAAGQTVEVPEGSGTTVAAGQPPRPPEPLLPAPVPAEPAADASFPVANPAFSWSAVAGAAGYQFELCGDEGCGRILAVERAIQGTGWRPKALARGRYFWRVSAVSASGLDGYPSPARALEIAADGLDGDPPRLAVEPRGRHARFEGALCVGERAALEVKATDAASGIDAILAAEEDGTAAPIVGTQVHLEDGAHTVRVTAIDQAGNRTVTEPLRLVVDTKAPEIAWSTAAAPAAKGRRWGDLLHLDWSRATAWWAPWQRHGRGAEASLPFAWIDAGRVSRLTLVALRDNPLQGSGPRLNKNEGLLLDFQDRGCGLDRVSVSSADAGRFLQIEVADRIGNVQTLRWPIAPR